MKHLPDIQMDMKSEAHWLLHLNKGSQGLGKLPFIRRKAEDHIELVHHWDTLGQLHNVFEYGYSQLTIPHVPMPAKSTLLPSVIMKYLIFCCVVRSSTCSTAPKATIRVIKSCYQQITMVCNSNKRRLAGMKKVSVCVCDKI